MKTFGICIAMLAVVLTWVLAADPTATPAPATAPATMPATAASTVPADPDAAVKDALMKLPQCREVLAEDVKLGDKTPAGKFTMKRVWYKQKPPLPQRAYSPEEIEQMPPEQRARGFTKHEDTSNVLYRVKAADWSGKMAELQQAAGGGNAAECLHVGRDEQFIYLGQMPVELAAGIHAALDLKGGDIAGRIVEKLATAEPKDNRTLPPEMTLGMALGNLGGQAFEHIQKNPRASWVRYCIEGMAQARGDDVTQFLIKTTKSEDETLRTAARRALLLKPRKEAGDLYVAWLEEAVSSDQSRGWEAGVCAGLKIEAALPVLKKAIQSPRDANDHVACLLALRKLLDQPLDDALEEAYRRWRASKTEDVVAAMLAAKDQELAAAYALQLALLSPGMKDQSNHEAIGIEVLRRLKDNRGKALVRLMIAKSKGGDKDERLKWVAEQLEKGPGTAEPPKPTPGPSSPDAGPGVIRR